MSLLQNPSQKFCWQGNNNNANEVSAVEESLYRGSDVQIRGCWRSLAPAEAGKNDGHLHTAAADTPSPPLQSA